MLATGMLELSKLVRHAAVKMTSPATLPVSAEVTIQGLLTFLDCADGELLRLQTTGFTHSSQDIGDLYGVRVFRTTMIACFRTKLQPARLLQQDVMTCDALCIFSLEVLIRRAAVE